MSDTNSPTMTIADKFNAMEAESRRQWRQWATDLADSKPSPSPRAVLEAAAILGITPAGESLEADADAIREMRQYHGAAEKCREARREALSPWKGSTSRLAAALAQADAEASRLREISNEVSNDFNAWQWEVLIHHLKRNNPRVFDSIDGGNA